MSDRIDFDKLRREEAVFAGLSDEQIECKLAGTYKIGTSALMTELLSRGYGIVLMPGAIWPRRID